MKKYKVTCYLDDVLLDLKRKGRRVTKVEIAKTLNTSKQAITTIAQGKNRPLLENALLMADYLGVGLDDLWKLEWINEEEDSKAEPSSETK